MRQYHDLLHDVVSCGEVRKDRTGVGTVSLFSPHTQRYDLRDSFPLVTTKRVFWRAVVGELLWMLEGSTSRNRLERITFGTRGENATIWDEWADRDGSLGPIYGWQWRNWFAATRTCEAGKYGPEYGYWHRYVDQISAVIKGIREDPTSRRHIVSAWNVGELDQMALPPCHVLYQFYVNNDGRLDCHLFQRSCDLFLGCPFNIASYSLLTVMVAHVTGLKPGTFFHTIGDAHIYLNHMDAVQELLSRKPLDLPTVRITKDTNDIFSIGMEDIVLEGYAPHPAIKAEVAV